MLERFHLFERQPDERDERAREREQRLDETADDHRAGFGLT